MHSKTVKDYMVPWSDYPAIKVDKTLEQAVDMINDMASKKGYRWIIVTDENNDLVGFLTLRSIFEAIDNLVPQSGDWMGISTRIQLIKDTSLRECMKPMVNVTTFENDPPMKVAELILNNRVTIVPVLNDKSDIVGIIRPVDLLPFIKELFDKN
ncbi:MAG: CBS domain-containing protein [Firmicutes bacterium]|nr:CBS domain-containing protein [Bacillota bacterium]